MKIQVGDLISFAFASPVKIDRVTEKAICVRYNNDRKHHVTESDKYAWIPLSKIKIISSESRPTFVGEPENQLFEVNGLPHWLIRNNCLPVEWQDQSNNVVCFK